jgi:hypothetical protein
MKAHKWNMVQIYSFFDLGAGWDCVVNDTFLPIYPREIEAVPIVLGGRVGPRDMYTVEENIASTGIRSPNCTARSSSLILIYSVAFQMLRLLEIASFTKNVEGT